MFPRGVSGQILPPGALLSTCPSASREISHKAGLALECPPTLGPAPPFRPYLLNSSLHHCFLWIPVWPHFGGMSQVEPHFPISMVSNLRIGSWAWQNLGISRWSMVVCLDTGCHLPRTFSCCSCPSRPFCLGLPLSAPVDSLLMVQQVLEFPILYEKMVVSICSSQLGLLSLLHHHMAQEHHPFLCCLSSCLAPSPLEPACPSCREFPPLPQADIS